MDSTQEPPRLAPLAYHREIVDYLKTEDPALWQWFAERRENPEQAAAVRLDLLKSTYRIERPTQPELYALAEQAVAELKVAVPLTLYQAQHPLGLNASLAHLPAEAHIVLSGPVTTTLSAAELKALFGHELAHRLFWEEWDGDFQTAALLLDALANDAAATPVYNNTSRLYALYTELFCDRAAWLVTQNLTATVSTLVKISTGLAEVSAESYLRQAEEIFSQANAKTEGLTHPEIYIRARALQLWSERGDASAHDIAAMLAGPPTLSDLDLLGQKRIAELTRRLIDELLLAAWLQSETVLAHARGFFEDYTRPAHRPADEALAADIAAAGADLQDYYSYVLLDFATVDRDLEELPLAAALTLARRLGLAERLKQIALKEMKLTKKRFDQIDRDALELIAKAERQPSTP